ncbi:MAG: aspartate carbamoyltransferase catalytic subunit [Candidatus Eisenbacteria bacterium]
MTRGEINDLLADAQRYRDQHDRGGIASHALTGVTVCNAFFESSTRTRVSFELAGRRLGATVVSFSAVDSSTVKGETLLDTIQVVEAMGTDLVVVRHPSSGAAAYLAGRLRCGVINAGDGTHEHPTQGLLDLLTLRQVWGGRFEGRRLAIVGDIAHSRVARSAIHGLVTLGTEVVVAGPATLMPAGIEGLGARVAPSADDAVAGADAVMALRLQRERMEQGLLASLGEYSRHWGIDARRVGLLHPDGVVMHPGPVNRGVELMPDVADSGRSVILEQVTNGVAMRCAVLERCAVAVRSAA